MYEEVLTFVLAGGDGQRLRPLTTEQPKATLPIGGVFRLMDFALSNILNSQLRRIFILTKYHDERVTAYVQQAWAHVAADFRLDCGEDLVCLPPAEDLRRIGEVLRNTAAAHVLVVSADQIYQFDYRKLLRSHITSSADFTSPAKGIYVFTRNAVLRDRDVRLERYAPEASGVPGYFRTIETLDDYYSANMDLLTGRIGFSPYCDKKLLQFLRFAVNSRIALGARLNTCRISDSVVSGGVRIEAGALVEDSVILPGSHIGPAEVRRAIVAENAIIPAKAQLGSSGLNAGTYSLTPCGVSIVANQPPASSSVRQIRRRCARVATKRGLAIAR
jgi:ADP-glucose pyrophosphorylase